MIILSSSDDGLELGVRQLVDGHDLVQLLGVAGLVLHEVGDANFVHLSQFLEPLHVLKRHLRQQAETKRQMRRRRSVAAESLQPQP